MADNNNQSTSDSSIAPPSKEYLRFDDETFDWYGGALIEYARRLENQSFRDDMSPEQKAGCKRFWDSMYRNFKNALSGGNPNEALDENARQKVRGMLRETVELHKLLDQQDAEEAVEKYGLLQFLE